MIEKKLGHHIIAEITNCNRKLLDNEIEIVNIMLKACVEGGAGILGHISNKFQPQGVTVVVGLSESHASIHTWPEYGYAMLDVCTCGETVKPQVIFETVAKFLDASVHVREVDRGLPTSSIS